MFEVYLREVRSLLETCSKSTWDIFEVYLRHVRSNAESFSQTVGERHFVRNGHELHVHQCCELQPGHRRVGHFESQGHMQVFSGSQSFNWAAGEWDTPNVTIMNYMFNGAVSFKQAISEWDTRRLAGL